MHESLTQGRTGLWCAALLALVLAAGCASVPAPHTPRQTLGYTEASYTAAVKTLNGLHDQGALSAAAEQRLDRLVRQGDAYLDAAHAAESAGDVSTLQGKLAALDALLINLRTLIAKEASDG